MALPLLALSRHPSGFVSSLRHRFAFKRCQTTASKVRDDKKSSPSRDVPKITTFTQAEPRMENQYSGDTLLRQYLKRVMPADVLREIEPDLGAFGHRCANDIRRLGLECERDLPYVVHYDAWGNRIDRLVTSESWRKMKDVSAEEGLISIAYERRYREWSRLYQLAKIYLFTRSSGLYGCPLAMTDGAAKTIETLKLGSLHGAFERLVSRDPKRFWTSGQWMTEKQGGSDVANGTETVAVPQNDGSYRLYGYKWFSSATDSNVALTLGRIADDDKQTIPGTGGLSMFYLEVRDEKDDGLNGIEIVKLKNKLGTRQVPTAELILNGSAAYLISEPGKGVQAIANMLNVTRIHNALASTAAMRQILSLARDYAHRRVAFGKPVVRHPLHVRTLAIMDLECRGSTLLALEASRMLGLHDCGDAASPHVQLLRLLTPLVKLFTAKQAMPVVSEGLEAFGGQGYIEDTGLPGILRDAQVTPIWEGTTNVLCLDLLRVLRKHPDVVAVYAEDVRRRLSTAARDDATDDLRASVARVSEGLDAVLRFLSEHQDKAPIAARDLAFSLTRVYIGALMIEHAAWKESSDVDKLAARRWCQRDLTSVMTNLRLGLYANEAVGDDARIVLDGYSSPSA